MQVETDGAFYSVGFKCYFIVAVVVYSFSVLLSNFSCTVFVSVTML